MAHTLSEKERLAWLRLIRSENVGPITFYRLLDRFGSAATALKQLPDMARRGGSRKQISICSQSEAEKEWQDLSEIGGQFVMRDEETYPPLLGQIEDAPPVIAVRGHLHLLRKRSVAIVGARNASMAGCKFAGTLARDLGQAGFLVVSGLARGVDGAAHAGSLDSGTVGVLGGGVDVIYPRENDTLYKEMCERGCLLSEPKLGTKPQARHFPRRNRIISGMSRAVVVVEASPRSGSLITARMALEQGREVFAVPGSPMDPRSRGANGLIRDGATLIESAGDVISALSNMNFQSLEERKNTYQQGEKYPSFEEGDLNHARDEIIKKLSQTPVLIDEIIRECQISASVVQTVLLELELAGRLERHAGNKVSLLF